MSNRTWPTLFKKNSDNKSHQQWTISVHTDENDSGVYIQKKYGQVGGKMVTSAPDYITGKNIGKKNETTPYEQAVLEAQAQWTKKQTGAKGYTPSMTDAEAGVRSEMNTGAAAPMLAKKYGKLANDEFQPNDNKKIVFPAMGQPKLNGNRLIVTITDGIAVLTSRDCKPINTVPSLKAELETVFAGETVTLDGEMYNHEFHEHLEDLRHMIAHDDPRVQYHVYDLIDPDLTFEQRNDKLVDLFAKPKAFVSQRLFHVMTFELEDHDKVMEMFDWARANQYEGLMIRNKASKYGSGKRSSDLQKLKGWLDREFLIVEVIEKGRGKDAGKAKFHCITGEGDPIPGVHFEVDIAASQEIRADMYSRRDELAGKWLTVQFAYYTQVGKPFHAQGQEIRDEAQANIA